MTRPFLSSLAALFVAWPSATLADAPRLQNTGPIIYLADNLDEADELGYCIDTLGRGQSDAAQLHSCKPDTDNGMNRDVLFAINETTGRIEHQQYAGICLTLNEPGSETAFGLLPCEDDAPEQRFAHDAATGAIHPADDSTSCLAGATESSSAGPYMARPLELRPCDDVAPELRTWAFQN